MLKAGIFVDVENLSRNGGWGMQYRILRQLVEANGGAVVRANAYLSVDTTRENLDYDYRVRNQKYRSFIRKSGFHLVLKTVRRYSTPDGETVLKANADLDLAVDALLQAENLDYVLLCSGDGDFLRLVRALQNRGRRVDLLSFGNTSRQLQEEVDNYINGFMVPDLLRNPRYLGLMHDVNEERGFGFVTTRVGLGPDDVRDDIFCHISDVTVEAGPLDNAGFAELKRRDAVLEFDLRDTDRGLQAVDVVEYVWGDR